MTCQKFTWADVTNTRGVAFGYLSEFTRGLPRWELGCVCGGGILVLEEERRERQMKVELRLNWHMYIAHFDKTAQASYGGLLLQNLTVPDILLSHVQLCKERNNRADLFLYVHVLQLAIRRTVTYAFSLILAITPPIRMTDLTVNSQKSALSTGIPTLCSYFSTS